MLFIKQVTMLWHRKKYQKKVAKYASQDLEKLLNLKSDDKISVKINVSDLKILKILILKE